MKIYTSYFANLKNIPDSIVPISVCRRPPKGYNGLEYKVLAPSFSLLSAWKKEPNETAYRTVFGNLLNHLDSRAIIDDLYIMASGKDIVLVCYEGPSKFCHRHLIAEWLNKHGYDVKEWEGDKYET